MTREAARLRAVRSLVSSRSYSASEPRTPIIIRPAGSGRVDAVGYRHQGDTALSQFLDGLKDVPQVSA